MSWYGPVARYICLLTATVLLGGLLGATLVRLAPGFGVDEQDLDARLSGESQEALRQARAKDSDVLRFYLRYLAGMVRGDLGESRSLNRPVGELLVERAPVTLRVAGIGLLLGWTAGLMAALLAVVSRSPVAEVLTTVSAGFFLCLPSAVLALLLLVLDGPPAVALSLVVFPRVFRYAREILSEARDAPHILTARAAGLPEWRILWRHLLIPKTPQLLALAGVSAALAFSAAIPVEAVSDEPGIGALAWQAALSRDLPLLVNLTMVVTVVSLAANAAADMAIAADRGGAR